MKESILERNARLGTEQKIADFMVKQKQPYEYKVRYAEIRAREFYDECSRRGLNTHVSVGGLDSITLLLFLRSIGIDVPAISVSTLEDKSIQHVHEQLGIERLKPLKSKVEIIREFGYPVLSKEIAGKIELLQNPTEKNVTVRHAIITGETGAYGGNRKESRMKLAQKWLDRFGGADEEGAYAERLQLFRQNDDTVLSVCDFYQTGFAAAGARTKRTSAGDLRRNHSRRGRNIAHNKGAKNGMLHVRFRNSDGEAAS